jgi:hypothetical protein
MLGFFVLFPKCIRLITSVSVTEEHVAEGGHFLEQNKNFDRKIYNSIK